MLHRVVFAGLLLSAFHTLVLSVSPSLAGPPTQADEATAATDADDASEADATKASARKDEWMSLRGKWEVSSIGGEGPVELGEEKITLGMGDPITGIRWTGKFPRDSYEFRCEGRRIDGYDFFCGVTFPVGQGKCSLILGGWGGGVLGLSNVDGEDASSNPTTQFKVFDNDQWYKVRIRVDPEQITCWIDDKLWVEQERENRSFDIRIEMDPFLPLGLANYQCVSEFRKVQWRPLNDQEPGKASGTAAEESAAESASQSNQSGS